MSTSAYFKTTLAVIIAIFVSCKKDQPAPNFHYSYFDLTPGRYVDYSVMEIEHDVDQIIEHDTVRYELRTLISEEITDNEGRVARKFIRFKRNTSSDPWVQSDVWTAIIDDNRAELVEENQRVVKLIFAPTLSKEWNANMFNTYDELECFYRDIHDEQTVNSFTFDSTLVVEQQDEITLIDYRRKFEVYANHVGLVYKHFKDLSIEGFDTLNVKKGKELFYTYLGHGIQ